MLSEAYSFSYKHAVLHTHVFDNAVKRYRQRTRTHAKSMPAPAHHGDDSPHSMMSFDHPHHSTPRFGGDSKSRSSSALGDHNTRVQKQLEAFPLEILLHARTFHDEVQYFIGLGHALKTKNGKAGQKEIFRRMPERVKQLLSDITDADMVGQQIREEILHDDHVRKVCVGTFVCFFCLDL